MAITTADKEKIKAFGIDPEKLIEAIKAETEVTIEIPADITVLKTTDLEVRDANKVTEGKKLGETEGEKKGKELAAKAFKRKLALPDTVPNDIDKVLEAANEQLSKGDAGLKEQVNLLLKDKETLQAQVQAEQTKAKQSNFDAELISYFPAGRDSSLSDAERLALVKMNLQFEEAEGKVVVKKNGVIVQHKDTHAPLAPKDVVAELFTEKKWVAAKGPGDGGGRGGGDNGGGTGLAGIKKLSQFTEKWVAENPGKNDVSPEFQAALDSHTKDMTDFNFYE